MALSAGTRLGHYDVTQVSAQIGDGGMREVYQACDTKLDRTATVKVRGWEWRRQVLILIATTLLVPGTLSAQPDAAGTSAVAEAESSAAKFDFVKWAGLVFGLTGSVLGLLNYLSGRGTARMTRQIKVDQLLNRAFDRMGGRDGTTTITTDLRTNPAELELANREIHGFGARSWRRAVSVVAGIGLVAIAMYAGTRLGSNTPVHWRRPGTALVTGWLGAVLSSGRQHACC